MIVLDDQDARDAIATDLDSTFVVEAAAGTGKTTELVRRIVRVLATGKAGVGNLVAVTFTEKAAGELKLRLRQELERTTGPDVDALARRRLDAALMNLEEAHVSTIHGFCADILRERPVEAGIDPLFRVLTEAEARRFYAEAFDAWFQQALENTPEGVRRSLRRSARPAIPGGEVTDDGPVERTACGRLGSGRVARLPSRVDAAGLRSAPRACRARREGPCLCGADGAPVEFARPAVR
jgi:superfamily I DNA/RNA helicase